MDEKVIIIMFQNNDFLQISHNLQLHLDELES